MAKKHKLGRRRRNNFLLILGSLVIIFSVTFSIGRYWVEIVNKYQEKKELSKGDGFLVINGKMERIRTILKD